MLVPSLRSCGRFGGWPGAAGPLREERKRRSCPRVLSGGDRLGQPSQSSRRQGVPEPAGYPGSLSPPRCPCCPSSEGHGHGPAARFAFDCGRDPVRHPLLAPSSLAPRLLSFRPSSGGEETLAPPERSLGVCFSFFFFFPGLGRSLEPSRVVTSEARHSRQDLLRIRGRAPAAGGGFGLVFVFVFVLKEMNRIRR